jgi:hypothetical protein
MSNSIFERLIGRLRAGEDVMPELEREFAPAIERTITTYGRSWGCDADSLNDLREECRIALWKGALDWDDNGTLEGFLGERLAFAGKAFANRHQSLGTPGPRTRGSHGINYKSFEGLDEHLPELDALAVERFQVINHS